MRLPHQRWLLLCLSLFLLGCSAWLMVRVWSPQRRHADIREAFILLQTGGYTNEAAVLYQHMLWNLHRLPNKSLIEDWQRTVMLVDPTSTQPSNLIWRYHWTVRREMEKRAESSIQRARNLAEELQQEWGARTGTNRSSLPPQAAR